MTCVSVPISRLLTMEAFSVIVQLHRLIDLRHKLLLSAPGPLGVTGPLFISYGAQLQQGTRHQGFWSRGFFYIYSIDIHSIQSEGLHRGQNGRIRVHSFSKRPEFLINILKGPLVRGSKFECLMCNRVKVSVGGRVIPGGIRPSRGEEMMTQSEYSIRIIIS